MNWAFPKPRLFRHDVSKSGCQTLDVPETSNDVEIITSKTTFGGEIASTNEVPTLLEEIGSSPSSSKQSFQIEEIPNECSSKDKTFHYLLF